MKPIFVYTVIGIVVLFVLSYSPKNSLTIHTFDQQPESDMKITTPRSQHNAAAEDDDDGDLNNKIFLLFPEIDVDQIQREMVIYDKNHDGFVSFSESAISTLTTDDDDDDMMLLFEEERFNASDTDGDGLLNLAEFNHFLHSANTNSLQLQQWLCREGVWESNTDRDGKVDFREFFYSLLFVLVRKYDEENCNDPHHSDDSMDASANVFFSQLDKDCAEYSSDIELLPIIGKPRPSEHYYATKQSENFISQTQDDKDVHLTLIENAYTLYAAIFPDEFF
ncbi:hypothetical protein P8452_73884 [Trifolium repens]|nr:hypothetical protein P8452_73884 [Trifolium repens]